MEQTNENTVSVETQELAPQTELPPTALTDPKTLNTLVRLSKMFAASRIIPETFQNKPDDCFVACEMANRMGVSPLVVMQNLYIVKGKPTWSGQSCIALINGTRTFTPLKFVYVGDKDDDTYGCYVTCTRLSDGVTVTGTLVDIAMAKAEGWVQKNGSKWVTMPEQMLAYRAAAFFARVHCPHALMGLQTVEEVQDVKGYDDPTEKKVVIELNKED